MTAGSYMMARSIPLTEIPLGSVTSSITGIVMVVPGSAVRSVGMNNRGSGPPGAGGVTPLGIGGAWVMGVPTIRRWMSVASALVSVLLRFTSAISRGSAS